VTVPSTRDAIRGSAMPVAGCGMRRFLAKKCVAPAVRADFQSAAAALYVPA